MLVVAALVPDTALLVPGVAGQADALADLRRAALAVVAEVVGADVSSIVVVAPGRSSRELAGEVRPSLAAAGVPDELLGWPVDPLALPGPGADRPGVPAAVALHLLMRAGNGHALRVVEVAASTGAGELAVLGRALVDAGPTGLVVVGSASGRHGPDAPLADDPRAPAHDARLLADLADAGPAARARLAADDPRLADELAVRGWAPWQVLVGAAGDAPVRASLRAESTALGAHHAVVLWDAR